jgi:hypothetical protein
MAVDARRLGGLWAGALVVAADRFFLRLRVARPPRATDCAACIGASATQRKRSSLIPARR